MTNLPTELDTILGRLRALDASNTHGDRAAAENALASYLSAHNVPRRPVRWAVDAHEAFRLVAATDAWAEKDELFEAGERMGEIMREKGGSQTEAQRERAPNASLNWSLQQLWDFVERLVKGQDVSLSVPWYLYHPRYTPDRGRRAVTSDHWVWRRDNNLVELLYRIKSYFNFWREDTPLQQAVGRLLLRITRNMLDAYDAGLWIFWMTATEIIALPRPTLVLAGGRLHAEAGPAVSWPGSDQRYFFLNGVHVPEQVVESTADRLDPRLMLFERNADVRREIVRKVGIERICEAFNALCVDRRGDYELLLLDLRDGRVRPFLKMRNPSIQVWHVEGVHPNCRTVKEALAWRNGIDDPPEILT